MPPITPMFCGQQNRNRTVKRPFFAQSVKRPGPNFQQILFLLKKETFQP
jgi:hypothetical protein